MDRKKKSQWGQRTLPLPGVKIKSKKVASGSLNRI